LYWRTNRKSYMVYRTATFSMTLNDHYPRFHGHAILWRWLSQKRYEIHSFNGILIGNYTRPTQQCHFEWPWVILSDLAKYLMTQSMARPLCDSRATCFSIPSSKQASKHLYLPKSQHTEYTCTHNNDKQKGRLPEKPQKSLIAGRLAEKNSKSMAILMAIAVVIYCYCWYNIAIVW